MYVVMYMQCMAKNHIPLHLCLNVYEICMLLILVLVVSNLPDDLWLVDLFL